VEVEGEAYNGVTNIGYNPTFGNDALSIETHILDFSEELLGRRIQVHFLERLRSEQTFENVEALARQITSDIERARETFSRLESE
jgi:riboflavin kinase/FMN adenylyltransferase